MKTFAYLDFYPGFANDVSTNILTLFLIKRGWQLVDANSKPDLLVVSVFGNSHRAITGIPKLLWSGENIVENAFWRVRLSLEGVTYALVSNDPTQINLPTSIIAHHVPYGAVHYDIDQLDNLRQHYLNTPKTKFCCFVVSNYKADEEGYYKRDKCFTYFNQEYKRVDSGGGFKNNVGYLVPRELHSYLAWVSQYKFMICFENTPGAGYFTEKILTPYAAGTVPIYWGDQSNLAYLNSEAYVLFSTLEETLAQVKELDSNEELYQKKRRADLLTSQGRYMLSRNRFEGILEGIAQQIELV